jgi:hypothetical protein
VWGGQRHPCTAAGVLPHRGVCHQDLWDNGAGGQRRRSDSIEGVGRGGNNDMRGRRDSDSWQDWRNQDGPRGRIWRGGRCGGDPARGRKGSGGGRGGMYAYWTAAGPVKNWAVDSRSLVVLELFFMAVNKSKKMWYIKDRAAARVASRYRFGSGSIKTIQLRTLYK